MINIAFNLISMPTAEIQFNIMFGYHLLFLQYAGCVFGRHTKNVWCESSAYKKHTLKHTNTQRYKNTTGTHTLDLMRMDQADKNNIGKHYVDYVYDLYNICACVHVSETVWIMCVQIYPKMKIFTIQIVRDASFFVCRPK